MGAPGNPKDVSSFHPLEGFATDRRSFIKQVSLIAAAAVGLPSSAGVKIAEAVESGLKPSVIWLHFQECTGCTETLLRSTHPDLAQVILDLISLDYHETLFAAAGHQIHAALETAMEQHKGKYVLVVEGAIPTKDNGIYCQIGGRTAVDILNEVAEHAGAIIAIGACASFGGIPAADPNPTGAKGAPEILAGKTVVTIPGCPPNPHNFLGTVLQYVALGTLPALDKLGRPRFAYGRMIHEHCPRRAHFDAGRFARQFGDEGHRQGYCLYQLGCKGPVTHANCSTQTFGEVGAWPIGIGHPCVGCTEEDVLWKMAIHETVEITQATPPALYPPTHAGGGKVDPVATGLTGLAGGVAIGAGLMAAKKISEYEEKTGPAPGEEE